MEDAGVAEEGRFHPGCRLELAKEALRLGNGYNKHLFSRVRCLFDLFV